LLEAWFRQHLDHVGSIDARTVDQGFPATRYFEVLPPVGLIPAASLRFDTALGQLARAGGEARVETDARGRLLRLEQRHRAPSGHVEAVEARWDPDGVGLTLDVEQHGGALTDALRCGPAGCAGGPGAVAQTWTCRAR
jgi:hypothetical protein